MFTSNEVIVGFFVVIGIGAAIVLLPFLTCNDEDGMKIAGCTAPIVFLAILAIIALLCMGESLGLEGGEY